MVNMIKQQIESLVKLQQIEIEAGGIQLSLESVEHRMQALDDDVIEFEKSIETEKTAIEELNHRYRAYESDVQINLERISKSKQKLNAVKTNKEYQSSLKEIENLEKRNSKIEDEMIEFLDRIEGAEKKIAETKSEYSKLMDQADTEKAAIKAEADRGKQRLSLLHERLDDISKGIDAKLLEQFNRTKVKQTNRIAMVAAKDAVCQGCNMNIPPQMYNELHRFDSLQNCPHCQRIIYLYEQKQRSE
jgi:predicted  nucleic acid-binding Zn-ribbon protein